MNLGLLISIAVTSLLYIGYIVIRYGVQSSISASYKNLETPIKKSLYSWFIAFVAIPMMIVSDNWMGVVAGMFLSIDFAAPTGGSKLNMFLHCLGADAGMLLGTAMLGFMFGQWWLVGIASFVVVITYWKAKNSTWWIECEVLAAVWIGLLIEKVL